MKRWIHEHIETISILTVILGGVLGGTAIAFVLIVIANLINIW